MEKKTRKFIAGIMLFVLLPVSLLFAGCGNGGQKQAEKKKVVIYSSSEDYKIAYFQKELKKKFPDYDVIIEYKSSGEHFNILKQSGGKTECDISNDLEYGYAGALEKAGILADMKELLDLSKYADDMATSTFYAPELRNGGAIIVNTEVLKAKGLKKPTSYEDLLDPQYKGLISMPNPKSSGTGYMFLLNLVNAWGEEKAFAYFDKLKDNIHSFTSSGSGPVNELKMKEIAIAFGMTSDAVNKINNDNVPLEIIFFEEGSPFSLYSHCVIKGKENRPEVREVYKFLINELTVGVNTYFYPEQIYKKDIKHEVKNFPTNIKYGDMSNATPERKEQLLKRWKY